MPNSYKEKQTIRLEVGDRVVPTDSRWLWCSPNIKLKITRCRLCEAPGSRGKQSIELTVSGAAQKDFKAWQFAEDYKRYDPPG